MNADNILFRCSSLGHIMTEPRSGKGLSKTCLTNLVDKYVSVKYGRETDIENRYTRKGLMVEEDSITLYSRYKRHFFKKNTDRLSNRFITGMPDLYEGESIYRAEVVPDIKSSWDIFTFFRNSVKNLVDQYYWQIQGYMALTGAKKGIIAYCLVNTPEVLINDEKRRLLWKMGVATEDNALYQEACAKLEKNMLYDDIPVNERVIEIEVPRNDEDIEKLYNRIIECRQYMNENLFKKSA